MTDQLIALTPDDDTSDVQHIRMSTLMSKSTYFRNVFRDISSNKDDKQFSFNVTHNTITMLINYMTADCPVVTLAMAHNDDLLSLIKQLGMREIDEDVYQLLVIEPAEKTLQSIMPKGNNYVGVLRDVINES